MNSQVAEDSTNKTHTADTRYKYTTDRPHYPSGLDPIYYFLKHVDLLILTLVMFLW